MLIKPKHISYFYYIGITAFALLCIAISAISIWPKILLGTLVAVIVWADDARARKTKIQSFKWIDSIQPYWLILSKNHQYVAALISRYTYRSRYFIILHWTVGASRRSSVVAIRTPEPPRATGGSPLHDYSIHPAKQFHALLCRWHYDADSWRALQVIVNTYPFNKTI